MYVINYFILICSYHKLTSQVSGQIVDTSYGLSFSYEQCRFFPLEGDGGTWLKWHGGVNDILFGLKFAILGIFFFVI